MTLQRCIQNPVEKKKPKMKLFAFVKNLSKFPEHTLNFPRKESKNLLLLKYLKQKINVKPLTLLVRLMARDIQENEE